MNLISFFLQQPHRSMVVKKEEECDDYDDDDDDLITLSGLGRITYWRYPKKKWQTCPVGQCNWKFEDRSDAIAHYKTAHSHSTICCHICHKAIVTYHLSNIRV